MHNGSSSSNDQLLMKLHLLQVIEEVLIHLQLKERSPPFQSNKQQPTQSLCQADVPSYILWVTSQQSSPPQPSTAAHAYETWRTWTWRTRVHSTKALLPNQENGSYMHLITLLSIPVLKFHWQTNKQMAGKELHTAPSLSLPVDIVEVNLSPKSPLTTNHFECGRYCAIHKRCAC